MNSFIDYYALLHVTPQADEELIKRAYRILSKKVHPDQGGDSQQFILLTQAYNTLTDPYKRKRYDQIYKSYMFNKETENDKKNSEQYYSHQENPTNSKSDNKSEESDNEKNTTFWKSENYNEMKSRKKQNTDTQVILSYAIIVLIGVSVHYLITNFYQLLQEEYIVSEINEDINSNSIIQTEVEDSISEPQIELPTESQSFLEENNSNDSTDKVHYTNISNLYFEMYYVQPNSEIYRRYYTRLRDMEVNMLENYTLIWEYGTYSEQSMEAQSYLTEWDKMLNEIYGVIRNSLSSEEFDNLRELQRDWISYRDINASTAAEYFEGGLQEEAIYYDSLLESTRERCYWLITNYLN